jgi:APA family basic amino acid/polyamine antiporter
MDTQKNEGSFKKTIGPFSGMSIVAGMVIGSGIYYLGSYVLERTGLSMGWSIVAWIVGGLITIVGGLCFAELGASMPVAGGQTVYLSEAYSPAFGFINGFSCFLLVGSGGVAALAMAAVTAYRTVFDISDIMIKVIAILIILALMTINLLGVKEMTIYQNFSMVIRLIPVLMIIILGFAVGTQSPDLSLSLEGTPAEGGGITGVISMVGFATFASLWAYDGWYNLNTVAEEMKNPKKDLPIAIIVSLVGVTLLYTLFNLAVYKVLPAEDISEMVKSGDLYMGNEVVVRILGGTGLWILLICMTIGIVGSANVNTLCDPRTYYAMAKEGYFPKLFAHLDAKRGVPSYGILVAAGMAILLVLFNNLQELTDMLIFTTSILNLMTIYGVLRMRKKYPDLERPYKVWGGKITIYLTSIVYIILMVNEFIDAPKAAITGIVITAAGLLVYLYFKKKNGGQDYKGEGIE